MITIALATLLMTADTPAAEAQPAAERRVCRSEQQVGSRLRTKRICRTAAEWQQYVSDREQMRRDVGNAAKDFKRD